MLADGRLVPRPVHRQHDGDGLGGARAGAARHGDAAGGLFAASLAGARSRARPCCGILQEGGPLPRDLVTRRSIENACAAVAATGGSTNAGLHLPAIAHEAGIRFTLDDVAEVFQRTPLLGDLQPGGRFLARDLHYAGGVVGGDPRAARRRLPSRRCADALRQTLGAGACGHAGARRHGRAASRRAAASDGGRRRAQGQPLPRRRADQDRRPPATGAARHGAGLRMRGGLHRGGPARATTARATSWSSATKGPRAGPACARCSARPR